MKNKTLFYGLIAGGILAAALLIPFLFMDKNNPNWTLGEIIGYSSMILSQLVIFFAIRDFRDKRNNGKINFSRALGVGMKVSLVAASIFVLFDTLYITVINPDFFDQYLSFTVEQMEADNKPQAEIDKVKADYANFEGAAGVFMNGAVMFVTVGFIGFLIALGSSFILRRPEDDGESPVVGA